MRAGADYLVVGRPIRDAADPSRRRVRSWRRWRAGSRRADAGSDAAVVPRDLDLVVRPDVALDDAALRSGGASRASARSPGGHRATCASCGARSMRGGASRFQLRVRVWRRAARSSRRESHAVAADVSFAARRTAGRDRRRRIRPASSPRSGSRSTASRRSCSSAASRCRRAGATSRCSTARASSIPSRTTASAKAAPGPTATASSTRARTSADRSRRVLDCLVAHGADPDILVDARPHVGSNRLPKIVTALRETLARCRRRGACSARA